MKKTTMLKKLITSSDLEVLMEAHNGLSAKIVEEAGFKGIWASGLAISASLGVRDNNELSWTQVLEILEFMSDSTSIPILLDGDTGYGNFNNARRLIKKLEQRNIAGVCIEDKLFPKTNSFINSDIQPLADINEFCGKIMAMKDNQQDDDFVIVARVEAFIAGWGLSEVLKRADSYRKAGADAILIHSKKNDASEVESFMKEWGDNLPVIIVPTKYYSVPTAKFKDLGVSVVIWANQNIRASIKAMEKISKQIFQDKSLINVESKIVPINEIFRLQGAKELELAEKKYLPTSGKKTNAIVLAASQGDFYELTSDIPKTLLKVEGKTILLKQVEALNEMEINDITVVRGFAKEKISMSNISTIDNDEYERTYELYSLYLAREKIVGNVVISYGDIIYKKFILFDLLNDNNEITIIVDSDYTSDGDNKDFVINDKPYSKKLYYEQVKLKKISNNIKEKIDGEFIGLWKVNEKGAQIVIKALNDLSKHKDFKNKTISDLFNHIVKQHNINVRYINGGWLDIDSIIDLQKAGDIID